MSALCPNCGYDVTPAEPVQFGDLSYTPATGVRWQGARLDMNPQCHLVLGALMRSRGVPIKPAVLAEIAGYEREFPRDYGHVLLSLTRRALRAVGAPFALTNTRGVGVLFNPEGITA